MTSIEYKLNLSKFTLLELEKLVNEGVISQREYDAEVSDRKLNREGNYGLN